MLELKNIAISHNGQQLLQQLSFVATKGEVTAICGPSGCGKTTLLKVILGLHPVDKGYISIDGELITALSAPAFRKTMAYVPQDLSFPVETVKELVKLPFTLNVNTTQPFSRERLLELWRQLGLDPSLYDKQLSEISGGELQRMLIANIGLLNKQLVIVDEPTSALDSYTSGLVSSFLQRIASQGATVVVATHDSDFACNKTVNLEEFSPKA